MASALTDRLEGLLSKLEEIWQPFAHPRDDWETSDGLAALIVARDRSLDAAAPVLAEVQAQWKLWEADGPDDRERSRIFSVRNRLVNLALEASKCEISMEVGLRRKIEEGRGQAAATTRRLSAASAYSRHVLHR